jgi:hypothetical protein
MTIYIIGEEGNLGTTESEPRVLEPGKGGNVQKKTQALWPASCKAGRHAFLVKRGGTLEEYRTWDYGTGAGSRRVFARVLPADLEPELAAIDAKVEATLEELNRLKKERRELLDAAVPRAEVVRVKGVA